MTMMEYFEMRRDEIDVNVAGGWDAFDALESLEYELFEQYDADGWAAIAEWAEIHGIEEDFSEGGSFERWVWSVCGE